MFGKHPVQVTLCFRSKAQRDWFMGQLSDGFGENECTLAWPKDQSLDDARKVAVTLRDETLEDIKRRQALMRGRAGS